MRNLHILLILSFFAFISASKLQEIKYVEDMDDEMMFGSWFVRL